MQKYLLLISAFFVFSTHAQTYKCKDKTGNWTEQACPDYEQRLQKQNQKAEQQASVKNWEPRIGMSAGEVRQIIKSDQCYSTKAFKWCGGYKVNTTKTARGSREQWVFTNVNGMPLRYLYFDNGVLSTIQD